MNSLERKLKQKKKKPGNSPALKMKHVSTIQVIVAESTRVELESLRITLLSRQAHTPAWVTLQKVVDAQGLEPQRPD